jgi:hypothetical protein
LNSDVCEAFGKNASFKEIVMPDQATDSGTLSTAMSKDGNTSLTPERFDQSCSVESVKKAPAKEVEEIKVDSENCGPEGGAQGSGIRIVKGLGETLG